jgi:hypothetical protein
MFAQAVRLRVFAQQLPGVVTIGHATHYMSSVASDARVRFETLSSN